MAVFSRVKTWVSNEVLTASDLNGEFNNIINNMAPSGIEDYSADVSQMQSTADPGGLGTESLATTLAGEIQRLRFTIKRIVGQAQYYIAPTRNFGTGALGVQTADIADGSVTQAKLAARATGTSVAAGGFAQSSSCNTFSTSSNSLVAITNLSVTIVGTGRPIFVGLMADGASGTGFIKVARTATSAEGIIYLSSSGSITTGTLIYDLKTLATGATAVEIDVPASSCYGIFIASAAGSYTFTASAQSVSSSTLTVNGAVLVAYEI